MIQNFTSYPATLPRGIIGYIEIPITQTTPPHYRVNDVNSLIHSVIHAYHPDTTTTPIQQNSYVDMNLCTRVTPQSLLEINKIEINDKTLQLPIPSVTGNLRPSDKIRKDFPPLPYSTENQQFLKKFNFEYSDLTDTEYVNLCNILINNQNCYAKHKNDVGKISTPFRIRIKDNCKLHTQRPSKVPIHYRDRLNKLLLELEKYNIIKQIGSTTDEKNTIGTTFLNPLIIIPEGDAIKVVLDARHLNSNTNQELESWPIEQFFKKQFSSQKTAYYAQVEAMSLMKKDNETVRHFALRVKQLVKKGWCNENAATINLKNNEIFTKGLPKKLKDFAHKRQVKHVSTLLEPSIPFHTLVRHVDSEDIADEKIRTNDLALEINKVSLEDDTNKKVFEHEDQIMVTQSGDPNNKSKPAYRKYCSYCHKNNHSISNCYQKQRDDEYQKYINHRSGTPQQSFVQYFRSKPNNPQENRNDKTNPYSSDNDRNKYNQNYYNDRYRNNDRYRSNSREYSQNNYRSNSRQRYYNRSRSPYRSRFDNYYQIIKEELHLDLHIDLHTEITQITDIILAQDTDLVLNHKETPSNDIIIHIDLHQDIEILDQDLEHPQETDNKTE